MQQQRSGMQAQDKLKKEETKRIKRKRKTLNMNHTPLNSDKVKDDEYQSSYSAK